MNYIDIIKNGIVKENPTFVLMLGMCPTLATTTSAMNGMSMGLATMAVLICTNFVISCLKNVTPDKVRIPVFIVVIAAFVTILQMFIKAYLPYAIEFGRAFVQPAYQTREAGVKALFALDNIWDGIGALVYNHPELCYMIGKVTIYPDYNASARALIYKYLEQYHRGEAGLFGPYLPLTTNYIAESPFQGEDKQENYHILQHAVREQGTVIPPMFSAYLNLTNDLMFFGNAINDELANVYETGIMVDIDTIYPEKKERYINPYVEWLKSQKK
jgi:hypothetical protein